MFLVPLANKKRELLASLSQGSPLLVVEIRKGIKRGGKEVEELEICKEELLEREGKLAKGEGHEEAEEEEEEEEGGSDEEGNEEGDEEWSSSEDEDLQRLVQTLQSFVEEASGLLLLNQ